MFRRIALLIVVCLALTTFPVQAQTNTPTNPNAQITSPPPVYVLGGQAEIIGTANVDGQVSYFIEYQPLGTTFEPLPAQANTWFPATLPSRQPVQNDVLGVWDTTLAPDGLYALRLTVVTSSGTATLHVVKPLRVNNTAPPPAGAASGTQDTDESINNALLALTATAAAFSGNPIAVTPVPTLPGSGGDALVPTPTPFASGNLTAEVLVLANLRTGDSTLYDIRAGLEPGMVLDVIGRSSRGTNWLFVETPNGKPGWVAPSVVRLSGDINAAQEVEPPPVPVTPTPVPSPTPILPDANVLRVEVDRDMEEDVPFQIIVTVRNDGGQFLPSTQIFCNVEPQNVSVTFSGGSLSPGTQGQFVIPLKVESGGGQNVNVICLFDPNNVVQEANENNNRANTIRFMEDN